MTINTFIKNIVICFAIACGSNSVTIHCMTMKSLISSALFETFKENKTAAIVAGISMLGIGALGYTTYKFWQTNQNQKQELLQKNNIIKQQAQILHLHENNIFRTNKKKLTTDFKIPSCIDYSQTKEKQKIDALKLKISAKKRLQNNFYLNEPEKTEIEFDIDNELATRAENDEKFLKIFHRKEPASIIQSTRKSEIKPTATPFLNELDLEKKITSLGNDFQIIDAFASQDNNDEKEKEYEGSSSHLLNHSLELREEQPILFSSEHFKGYRFDPISIINRKTPSDKSIVLVSIHGTFVDSTEFGKDKQQAISNDIIEFAQKLARDQHCDVILIPFCWSGGLSLEQRQDAGKRLAENLEKNCNDNQQIWTIAHSHGGNVVLHAAEAMKQWRPIDVAINIATPLADVLPAEPVSTVSRLIEHSQTDLNITNHFNAYSTGDVTQNGGSIFSGGLCERRINFVMNEKCKLWNIRVQDEGHELNHLNIIQPTIKNLHTLIPLILTRYANFHDLEANFTQVEELPHVTIRNLIYSHGYKSHLEEALQFNTEASGAFAKIYNRNIKDKVQYGPSKVAYELFSGVRDMGNKIYTNWTGN